MNEAHLVLILFFKLSVCCLGLLTFKFPFARKFLKTKMSSFTTIDESLIQNYLANHLRAKEIKEIVRSYTLTDGIEFQVKDYSVVGHDDRFYDRYGYNTLLHRGTCQVSSVGINKWVFGLPKFGNESPEIEVAGQWVFTVKANGECGHVAMIDSDHVVIGSKNVHIVLCISHILQDIGLYESRGEERLSVALKIAKLLNEQGLFSSPLIPYLFSNDITMIVEACFDNHIVRYESFQCVATCFVHGRQILSPADAYTVCAQYNFPHVEFDIASDREEYEHLKAKYQHWEVDSEGAVVYARGENGEYSLYKVKHPLYVVKRAARELIKRRANYAAWNKRMELLHVEVPASTIASLLQFYAWLLESRPDFTSDLIQEEFGKLYSEFSTSGYEAANPVEIIDRVDDSKNSATLVLGLCGIPGCGKSFLRNTIASNKQYKIAYVNQDELHQSRKKFLNALKTFSQQSLDILVVDKSNVNDDMRGDVHKHFSRVHWIVFEDENMIETCWQRIKERGVYHPSLIYSYNALHVLKGFSQSFERPVGDNVITIQIKDSIDTWVDIINRACGLTLNPTIVERTRVLPNIRYWMISLPENQHVTLVYQPSDEETQRLIPHFGEEVEVVTEVKYTNGRVEAAPVLSNPFLQEFCKNAIPHITLWTADGAEAVESNGLLANTVGLHAEPHERRYRGIVSFFIK